MGILASSGHGIWRPNDARNPASSLLGTSIPLKLGLLLSPGLRLDFSLSLAQDNSACFQYHKSSFSLTLMPPCHPYSHIVPYAQVPSAAGQVLLLQMDGLDPHPGLVFLWQIYHYRWIMVAVFNVRWKKKKKEFNKEHGTSNPYAGHPRRAHLKAAVWDLHCCDSTQQWNYPRTKQQKCNT